MTVTTTYTVNGMTCEHCERAVAEEVGSIAGVQSVEVSHETGTLTVASDSELNQDDVVAALDEAGEYTIAQA